MTAAIKRRLIQGLRRRWKALDDHAAGRILRRGVIGLITGIAGCALASARCWREHKLVWRVRRARWWREHKLVWWIRRRDLRLGWRARRIRARSLGLRCARVLVPALSLRIAAVVVPVGRKQARGLAPSWREAMRLPVGRSSHAGGRVA